MFRFFFGKGKNQLDRLRQTVSPYGLKYERAHFLPAHIAGQCVLLLLGVKIHVPFALYDEAGKCHDFSLPEQELVKGILLEQKVHKGFGVWNGESQHSFSSPR